MECPEPRRGDGRPRARTAEQRELLPREIAHRLKHNVRLKIMKSSLCLTELATCAALVERWRCGRQPLRGHAALMDNRLEVA